MTTRRSINTGDAPLVFYMIPCIGRIDWFLGTDGVPVSEANAKSKQIWTDGMSAVKK